VRYSDGEADVIVKPRQETGLKFIDGICSMRGVRELREWVQQADIDDIERNGIATDDPRIVRLARIMARVASEADRGRLRGHSFEGQLGSVIARPQGRSDGSGYAGVVHRDIDETAATNLRKAKRPSQRWYNVWLPLSPVTLSPLGLISGSSVDLTHQAAGYHESLPGDRTGLKRNHTHNWIWFPDLQPGDAILWHSEEVYHSSFELPPGYGAGTLPNPARRSLDLRLYFTARAA